MLHRTHLHWAGYHLEFTPFRERPNGAEIKLIALTGWGQEEDRRRTEAAGFNHHLVKPADINMLRALLE